MLEKTIALFGAGKIGRAFIAQIFARNGYSVVFIDVDTELIALLNQRQGYTVATLLDNGGREDYQVGNVQALAADDAEVMPLLCRVNLAITSVGANALQSVARILAQAAQMRDQRGVLPLDCILAENMRDSKRVMQDHLVQLGLSNSQMPGLIPASVGKTAPDLKPTAEEDPLLVFGDSYNTLTVAKPGWHHTPPTFPELQLVDTIEPYLDRKLFIHNLAHVAFAYLGFQADPSCAFIHLAMRIPPVRQRIARIMAAVIRALVARWSQEFNEEELQAYSEGVLRRMANPLLQDTLFRVGRDISRKLGREERIVGAMVLLQEAGEPLDDLAALYCAGLQFHAHDENGAEFIRDKEFHHLLTTQGIEYALFKVSKLTENRHKTLAQFIEKLYTHSK